ncbi:non-canonical purine NTP pyrophosphatase [Alishewanella longhuensis]|uniref:dITP/XTP pyrophosphatase n=1 Tax=Alishewanella longhuensis TaxID=1091037 RepID=A0ABQ3KXA3_9ALTE|nr:RdgB/HAM1 family non-canonical purine NTP pyrophosphatase [Alishewanella longhuensis]GHG63863.1 non-canonical purine NTP pyrophosphatase [Alishewanella longhuensis]
MQKVVLATGNKGKVTELSAMLTPFSLEVIPQTALCVTDAAETGLTFVENAILKARHAAKSTGLPAIADDSGLAVAALAGAPGIYSARYAGANSTDAANIAKLLKALATVPLSARQAAFHCVLVYMRHAEDPTPLICHGSWEGEIALAASGQGGFGYDPVFYLPALGKTAAEISATEKQQLSHRGQALRQLLVQLRLQQNGDPLI